MTRKVRNLVFEGGGILGIAYLGVMDYLYHNSLLENVTRVAGTSAGAITACVASFNLPFKELKEIVDTLDYSKIPQKHEIEELKWIPLEVKEILNGIFGDINCVYRLVNHYGWYSTSYFYSWIQEVIESQFDVSKKRPPYTFADFRNPSIHKDGKEFHDLYIVGTNLSLKVGEVFSFETTPHMEVAEAVRISMSVPLLFEAVKVNRISEESGLQMNVFCDGGVINNYPIQLFDEDEYNTYPFNGVNLDTLGVRFSTNTNYTSIDNLLEYSISLVHTAVFLQQEYYQNFPINNERSITIDTKDVKAFDFNVKIDDEIYNFLYTQGYDSAKNFFES